MNKGRGDGGKMIVKETPTYYSHFIRCGQQNFAHVNGLALKKE